MDAPRRSDPSTPLQLSRPVMMVGGGEIDAASLHAARARAAALIAADGGANRFSPNKGALAALVGDMDSVEDPAAWRDALGPRFLHLPEQETTDFEKCLYSIDAPLYLCVGFQGGRMDHSLGAWHVLLKRADRRVILLHGGDIAFLAPRRWRIDLEPGARVSLFPLQSVRAIRSEGLRWALDGLRLSPGHRVGVSNEASAARVATDLAGEDAWTPLVVVLESRWLDAVIESLGVAQPTRPPLREPAR